MARVKVVRGWSARLAGRPAAHPPGACTHPLVRALSHVGSRDVTRNSAPSAAVNAEQIRSRQTINLSIGGHGQRGVAVKASAKQRHLDFVLTTFVCIWTPLRVCFFMYTSIVTICVFVGVGGGEGCGISLHFFFRYLFHLRSWAFRVHGFCLFSH